MITGVDILDRSHTGWFLNRKYAPVYKWHYDKDIHEPPYQRDLTLYIRYEDYQLPEWLEILLARPDADIFGDEPEGLTVIEHRMADCNRSLVYEVEDIVCYNIGKNRMWVTALVAHPCLIEGYYGSEDSG